MATHTITVTLTDAQETTMQTVAEKAGKTITQIFQEFWDGYDSQKGAVRAQIDQWIEDELKTQLASMDSAEAIATLQNTP